MACVRATSGLDHCPVATRPDVRTLADHTVIGLISGTSIDGIDVAAADLHADGDQLVLTPRGHLELDYPAKVRDDLLAVLPPNTASAQQLTQLDTWVGQAFGDAAQAGIDQLYAGHADLLTSLGQTVFHWVEHGHALGTMQLGQPAWIAERTGLPVISDLRARDVAAGGHGAPLASTLDALWLRTHAESDARPAAAVNIGGIANITVVRPDGDVSAYDTGPGNALLDAAMREFTDGAQHTDVDGRLAARGRVQPELLAHLLADPYYDMLTPKSTGKEHFHAEYLHTHLEHWPTMAAEDVLATLTALTATTIARECTRHAVGTVVASGGGVDNPALMRALAGELAGIHLRTSDELGLPRSAKEAYLTAVLGWLGWHGLAANVPGATGARGPRLLGSMTPGADPLTLPPAHPTGIRSLRVTAGAGVRSTDNVGVTNART